MKRTTRFFLLTLSLVSMMILSLFNTVTAFADDETPPAPTEEPALPPAEEPVVTEAAPEDPAPAEEPSVQEILAQVPADTDLVVLDADGNSLPLVSSEVPEIIANSDPQFCPAGELPIFMGGTCTGGGAVQGSIGAALADAQSIGGSGTIWVQAGTFTEDVTIDGSAWSTTPANFGVVGAGSSSSTLDGYFFITNMNIFTLSGFAVLDDDTSGNAAYVSATGNSGDLQLTDLVVANENGGIGIDVTNHNGDVALNEIQTFADGGNGINIYANRDVSLTDVVAGFNSGDGININAVRDVTLTDVFVFCNGMDPTAFDCDTPSATGGNGIVIHTDGKVILDDVGSFANIGANSGNGDGIYIVTRGDISLNDVSAEENDGNGAYLDNCDWDGICYGTGNVSVTDSDFDENTSNGDDMGLELTSTGKVTLSSVSASDNWAGDGSDIYDFSSLSVQNSVFNDNYSGDTDWGYGLYISTDTGDVTLINVVASGNDSDDGDIAGAYVSTDGDVKVTGGNFSDNGCGCDIVDGLQIFDANSAMLSGVTASGNSGDGVYMEDVPTISVSGGFFNENDFNGLDFETPVVVTLENVQANGNGIDGAYIGSASPMDIDIICSEFSENSEFGLLVEGDGQVTLDRVTFAGNLQGDYFVDTATVSVFSGNCHPGHGKNKPGQSLPLNIVDVSSGQTSELNCVEFRGTLLVLPSGDRVLYPCPLQEQGKLETITQDTLPGALPEGNTYASGLTAHLFKGGDEKTKVDPPVSVSFAIPEGVSADDLAILFWDGTQWVEVDGAHVSDDGLFEAQVKFMGTYVLVTK